MNNINVHYLHELFERQTTKDPDGVALRVGDTCLRNAELNDRANRLAHHLIARRLPENSRIAICANRSYEMVCGILAVLKAGHTYVPVDPLYPRARIGYMLRDSRAAVLLTSKDVAHLPPVTDAEIVSLDAAESVPGEYSSDNPDYRPTRAPQELGALLIYTSGSTGRPKGVLRSHGSIVNLIKWHQAKFPSTPDDVLCLKTSMSFIDHVDELFQGISGPAPLVLINDERASDPERLIAAAKQEGLTRMLLVPSMLKKMLSVPGTKMRDLGRLRYVFCSGEPLYYSTADEFYRQLPNARLFNVYGSTEAGANIAFHEVERQRPASVMRYFSAGKADDYRAFPEPLTKRAPVHADAELPVPNWTLSQLWDRFTDSRLPAGALSVEEYLKKLRQDVIPYLADVSSPLFIGHMTSALPSFVPEFAGLIAGLNQNMVKIETSKCLTFLERQVIAMIHRLFYGFDDSRYRDAIGDADQMLGIVASGGSLANVTALWCARNRSLIDLGADPMRLKKHGAIEVMHELGYRQGVIIGSPLMHYSIKKAASLLGLGERALVTVAQGDDQRLSTDALEACIRECRANKRLILAMVGIAGATETGTIDPLMDMARIAEKYKIHFHVDAAWGGALQFSETHRNKLRGIELADSITFCAHKQMYLSQAVSLCLFKDPLRMKSIATNAAYQAREGSFDLGQFTLEGSRPASSLLLHAGLHLLGIHGYGWLIDQGMRKAAYFTELLRMNDCFQVVGEPELNIVNYRYIPACLRRRRPERFSPDENAIINRATDAIQSTQFHAGRTFVSKTSIENRAYSSDPITVFRVAIANPLTSFESLREVLEDQLEIAAEVVERNQTARAIKVDAPPTGHGIRDESRQWAVPIGNPIDSVSAYLLGSDGRPVAEGECGELYIGGDGLALGYMNDRAATAKAFIPNPFSGEEGDRLFATGDLARYSPDEGFVLIGRKDNQVKIDGRRIELGEIESNILACAGVRDCVVRTVPETRGKVDSLVAYVVFDRDGEEQLRELHRHMKRLLPAFMIPDVVKVIQSVPLNVNGKVDRQELALTA